MKKLTPLILLVSLVTLTCGSAADAQQGSGGREIIHWSFPLERAAELLQEIYARPLTYEEPMRLWRGEMEVKGRLPNGSDFLVVRPLLFILPEWRISTSSPPWICQRSHKSSKHTAYRTRISQLTG